MYLKTVNGIKISIHFESLYYTINAVPDYLLAVDVYFIINGCQQRILLYISIDRNHKLCIPQFLNNTHMKEFIFIEYNKNTAHNQKKMLK